MQRIDPIAMRLLALCAVSLAIGACSSDINPSQISVLPKPDTLLRKPDWASFSGAKSEFVLRPVTSEDLVSAEGQCAFAGPEQAPGAARPDGAGGAGSRRGRAADDRVRRGAARGQSREGRPRRRRARRSRGGSDLYPRPAAGRLPLQRRSVVCDRACARSAANWQASEAGDDREETGSELIIFSSQAIAASRRRSLPANAMPRSSVPWQLNRDVITASTATP